MSKLIFIYGNNDNENSEVLAADKKRMEEMDPEVRVNNLNINVLKPSVKSYEDQSPIMADYILEKDEQILNNENQTLNITRLVNLEKEINNILVDRVHLFTLEQILDLYRLSRDYNVDVRCYGRLTDDNGKKYDNTDILFQLSSDKQRTSVYKLYYIDEEKEKNSSRQF